MTTEEPNCGVCADRIAPLERRLERERAARAAAEKTAEDGLRQLYERQMDAELLGQVAARANDAHAVDEAFAFALEGVLKRTGWSYGAVHSVAEDGQRLLPARVTRSRDDTVSPLCRFAEQTAIGLTDDIVGIACGTRQAAVAERVAASPMHFARRLVASQCGMRSAVAVPVLSGENVVAVMEFMSSMESAPRDGLLDVLMQVAAQTARAHEREAMARRLLHDALHDPLTALPNRQLFTDRLERAVLAHGRNGAGYAVLFIDLDRFKAVNDRLGHAVGDAVLLQVAGILQRALEADPATAQATVARMGGDEFCILVEDEKAGRIAETLAQRILASICVPMTIMGHPIAIGACIGIASGDRTYDTGDQIIRDADAAMYEAKAAGRAQTKVYNEAFRSKERRRDQLVKDMTRSVEAGFAGFSLVYQPIVSLGDGAVTGFEALARWKSPSGEDIGPVEFIPVAEETGLIGVLGDWIVDLALASLASFESESGAGALTMSINVSPRQLRPAFVRTAASAMERHGVHPSRINLEITESVALGDDAATSSVIRALRDLGVTLSIDGFGTGYSTFGYLQKFPFETLKIDRSFVSAMSNSQGGLDIVRAIVEMARGLGVSIVAEGTESEDHVNMLRLLGCEHAQGYYFSRPVDRDAACRLLRRDDSRDYAVA